MPDSEENLKKQQLKAALGMTASRRYSTIESEKMEKEATEEDRKAKAVRGLRPDERSVEKAKGETRKIAEGIAQKLTPLSPIDQEAMKEKTDKKKGTETGETVTEIQEAQSARPSSTRDNQKQINRVSAKGEKIKPRLAEEGRVQPQKGQPSVIKPGIGRAAKKAAAKALPVAAPLLSGIGGAALAYFIA